MKEFVEKLIERLEEKIKVTSLEIIVTGTKEKPYFEIKYKEVGKEEYNIGYSSYDLNNVFIWKDECFEIVTQPAEEYKQKPKTRIDHIRSMSVEEMADAIMERSEISTCLDFCQNFCGECEHIPESECKKCLIKYLNSPVEQQKTIPTEHFKERVNRVL